MGASSERLAIAGGSPVIPTGRHKRWPEITQADRDAITAVLDRGETWGLHATEVTALQDEYAAYCGAQYCLAVNSGTSALHCALIGAGVEPGSEVIVPAVSFVATAMAVLHAGATPVFCDVDPNTYNIAPYRVEALVTPRTAAIVPVHLHGLPAEMDEITAIASRRDVPIVEDAAQAHGATYRGRKTGTLGTGAAFSLNGSKNLMAGEGGLYVCNDPLAYKAARRLAVFGEDTPRPAVGETRAFWSHAIGWNYRIHEITATLARSQLRRLDSYNAQARRNAAVLSAGLTMLPGIRPPHIPDHCQAAPWCYRVRLDAHQFVWDGPATELRDRFIFALRAEGVAAETWQLYPLPAHPAFRAGQYYSWTPKTPRRALTPWRPESYPEATRLLDSSLVVAPVRAPLYVQDEALMRLYVAAFTKVVDNIGTVLTGPYDPIKPVPPIPASVLGGGADI